MPGFHLMGKSLPFKGWSREYGTVWALVRNGDSHLAPRAPGPDSVLTRAKQKQLCSQQRTCPRATHKTGFALLPFPASRPEMRDSAWLRLFAITPRGWLLHLPREVLPGRQSGASTPAYARCHTFCSLLCWSVCSSHRLAALAAHSTPWELYPLSSPNPFPVRSAGIRRKPPRRSPGSAWADGTAAGLAWLVPYFPSGAVWRGGGSRNNDRGRMKAEPQHPRKWGPFCAETHRMAAPFPACVGTRADAF